MPSLALSWAAMADIDEALQRLEKITDAYRHRGPFPEVGPMVDDPDWRIKRVEDAVAALDEIVRELLERSKSEHAE